MRMRDNANASNEANKRWAQLARRRTRHFLLSSSRVHVGTDTRTFGFPRKLMIRFLTLWATSWWTQWRIVEFIQVCARGIQWINIRLVSEWAAFHEFFVYHGTMFHGGCYTRLMTHRHSQRGFLRFIFLMFLRLDGFQHSENGSLSFVFW